MGMCYRCNLPAFDGAAGYAGLQCTCFVRQTQYAPKTKQDDGCKPAKPLTEEAVRRIVRSIGLRLGVHPTCWCRSCDRTVSALPQRMNICPACGDKRCYRAEHHDNECGKPPNSGNEGPGTA